MIKLYRPFGYNATAILTDVQIPKNRKSPDNNNETGISPMSDPLFTHQQHIRQQPQFIQRLEGVVAHEGVGIFQVMIERRGGRH